MTDENELAICVACGTQFDVPLSSHPKNCRICDDPRQFVPPGGQKWTSLAEAKGKHENNFEQDPHDERIWFITTGPKVWLPNHPGIWRSGPAETHQKLGIGERCILIQTPGGNILWDLIAWIDEKTVEFINSKGGLKAIVISHPHFWTTHLVWARIFNCPVYLNGLDKDWVNRADPENRRRYIEGPSDTILPGVTAVRTGGHFDGSMVLHFEKKLFIADSLMIVPSGIYHVDRPPGTISFVFFWSYPNMIPLPPSKIHGIWKALKPYEFEETFGGFAGQDIRDVRVKERVLESMKIQVRNEGHDVHAILEEVL